MDVLSTYLIRGGEELWLIHLFWGAGATGAVGEKRWKILIQVTHIITRGCYKRFCNDACTNIHRETEMAAPQGLQGDFSLVRIEKRVERYDIGSLGRGHVFRAPLRRGRERFRTRAQPRSGRTEEIPAAGFAERTG